MQVNDLGEQKIAGGGYQRLSHDRAVIWDPFNGRTTLQLFLECLAGSPRNPCGGAPGTSGFSPGYDIGLIAPVGC